MRAALEEAAAAIGAVDARVLACHLLGASRAWLIANPMHVLTESQDAQYESLVARRAMGMPVAYLTGTREFWGREFAVGPAVLIPRPETETLVEAALARLPAVGTALDLGSGSGAIAVTLACERPGAAICAVDASAEALEVARANAGRHGVKVEFLLGSWYAPVAGRRFDLVVANPPYVAEGDHHLGEGDLRFEPRAALVAGADGLDAIRAIVRDAPAHLEPGGWLLLEHGWEQGAAVRALLQAAGLAAAFTATDLAGRDRVSGAQRA